MGGHGTHGSPADRGGGPARCPPETICGPDAVHRRGGLPAAGGGGAGVGGAVWLPHFGGPKRRGGRTPQPVRGRRRVLPGRAVQQDRTGAAGGDPTTVLEELPTSGEGTASAARIEVDVPKFDTYAEAAAYLGEDIPLAPESTALAGRLGQQIHVSTNRNAVTLSTVYSIEETGVLFSANVFVEGGTPPTFGSYYGYTGEVELRQETAQTGTGCPALIYHTAGEHNTCEAYFIREGIVYNLFLTDTNDMSVLQRILDTF